MGEEGRGQPVTGEGSRARKEMREARLALAMRQNLRRRKAQARGRAGVAEEMDRGPAATREVGSSPKG